MLAERTDPERSSADVMIPPWVLEQAEGLVFMWTYKVCRCRVSPSPTRALPRLSQSTAPRVRERWPPASVSACRRRPTSLQPPSFMARHRMNE